MGLDQFLYRVKDVEKHKELSKAINDLDSELDRRYVELLNEFKEKHVDDIKLFKEKLVKIHPDLINTDVNRFGNKLYDLVRCMLDPDYDNTMEKSIELLLFNIFPLIHVFRFDEDEEIILRKKIVDNTVSFLKDLVKKIDIKEKEIIVEYKSLINKLDEMVDELNYNREKVMYWRKANMIHGWFLKNGKWVENNVITDIFKGSILDKLISDIEKVISLIEDNYNVNNVFLVEEKDSLYKEIVNLLPPTSGYFFGSTDIDNNYYKILKHTLKDLKNKYNPEDNYYYHASW